MSKSKHNESMATEIIHDLAAELKAHKDALTELQKMAASLSGRIKAERENMESCLNRLGERR